MHEDVELLRRWQGGDEAAARTLIERHQAVLLRFLGASAPSAADDLLQELWIACVRNHEQLVLTSSFRAYALGIARNLVLVYWRTHARRGEPLDFDAVTLDNLEPSPSQVFAHDEQTRRLVAALRQLPLEQQLLLQLFYWGELSGSELARALGVPEGTVRGRLRAAKAALAQILGPDAAAR